MKTPKPAFAKPSGRSIWSGAMAVEALSVKPWAYVSKGAEHCRETWAARLYEKKYVLVRPDGHVGWRSDVAPADPKAALDTVRAA